MLGWIHDCVLGIRHLILSEEMRGMEGLGLADR